MRGRPQEISGKTALLAIAGLLAFDVNGFAREHRVKDGRVYLWQEWAGVELVGRH